MNNELISREALKKAITEATYNFEQIPIRVDEVLEIINNAPTVEERPKGKWEDYSIDFYKCPECGYLLNKKCPHCGNKVTLPKPYKKKADNDKTN